MSRANYGLDGPWELSSNRILNPNMVQQMPSIHVPIKHWVNIAIAPVEGGFLLSVNPEGAPMNNPILCVGTESIATGVQAILAHLVTGKLES